MRNCLLALAGLTVCVAAIPPVQAQPPAATAPTAPAKPEATGARSTTDVTRPYRQPGELIPSCGALVVKDLGLWPDMQAAFERGEVLEIVNLPLAGCINARGQVIAPLAEMPADVVARPEADGLVQYSIKSRPSAGRINARGDVMGALFVDNPDPGVLPIIQRAFVFPAGAPAPITIDVPAGMRLDVTGLNDSGVGVGNLFHVVLDPALPPDGPFIIDVDHATGTPKLRPAVDRAKLPPGLLTTTAWTINNKGEVLLNLQRDTGERNPGMFIDKDGKRQITCPNIIGTVEQCAVVRGDAIEIIPLPEGIASMAGGVLLDDGTIVGHSQKSKSEGAPRDGFVWGSGRLSELKSFAPERGGSPSGADVGLICGQATVPDSAMGKPPKEVDPALREAFYTVRNCGVLWDMETGTMLVLDSLLPEGNACTHIALAGAIKGDKLLCTGLINGKMHGLVVTLPPKVREGFKKGL